jgi:hypothetical protein
MIQGHEGGQRNTILVAHKVHGHRSQTVEPLRAIDKTTKHLVASQEP